MQCVGNNISVILQGRIKMYVCVACVLVLETEYIKANILLNQTSYVDYMVAIASVLELAVTAYLSRMRH